MRRFWIIPATLVFTVGLAATATAATAATPAPPAARATANTCLNAASRFQKASSSASGINPSNPNSLSQVFTTVLNALKSLANNGPKSLRSAFRDLANLYAPLVHLNLSNPASLSQLEAFATSPRYLADLHKIAAYFAAQCHVTIPTPTT